MDRIRAVSSETSEWMRFFAYVYTLLKSVITAELSGAILLAPANRDNLRPQGSSYAHTRTRIRGKSTAGKFRNRSRCYKRMTCVQDEWVANQARGERFDRGDGHRTGDGAGPEPGSDVHESMLARGTCRDSRRPARSPSRGVRPTGKRARSWSRSSRSARIARRCSASFGWLLRFIGSLLFAHVLFEKRSARQPARRLRARHAGLRDADPQSARLSVLQLRVPGARAPTCRFANGIRTGLAAWAARVDQAALLARALRETRGTGAGPRLRTTSRSSVPREAAHRASGECRVQPALSDAAGARPAPRRLADLRGADAAHLGEAARPQASELPGRYLRHRAAAGFLPEVRQLLSDRLAEFSAAGQPLVQISTTINLQEFLREYPNAGSADASELLRERVSDYLDRERHVVLGPTGEKQDDALSER